MSDALKIMLENIEQLTVKEKALAAHCLLTSMEPRSEESVESEWLKLAESRSRELASGQVQGLSWDDIKGDISG